MNRQASAVANRLSLRPPQRRSLEILDQVMEAAKPSKSTDKAAALAAIQQAFPEVADFERDFPSLCFALATGVGKTRLMGAFISYLRLAYARGTIDIPRVLVTPIGSVQTGFNQFTLDVSSWNYQALTEELWIKHLRTHETEVIKLKTVGIREARLEDYLVAGLIDFDDVSYEENAELLYELAGQAVKHFRSYLSEDDTRKVLQAYQRPLAINIHAQMHEPGHYWEKVEGYDVQVRAGFTSLKEGAYSVTAGKPVEDFRTPPADKSKIQQMVYGGFSNCLYSTQRFQADNERKLAVILDRETTRWFKPLKDQFQIFYRLGVSQSQYVPDFVAETADTIWMLEAKARRELATAEVLAKKEAALTWSGHASTHTAKYGGKPWKYALIPDDMVDENMSLEFLVRAGLTI